MNFEDMPEHIRRRHPVVPPVGKLDSIELPRVTMSYAEVEIIEPDRKLQPVLDNSSKLDSLTKMALEFYEELLCDGPSSDPKMLSSQESAARTILTTQLRVDDSRLKKRQTDTLAELLERMNKEDERLRLTA